MLPTKRNTAANALRRGRVSLPRAHYFVTVCIEPRRPVRSGATATAILDELQVMHASAVWRLRCASVMPDHLHLFFALGERLTLSQSLARLKSRTRSLLAPTAGWQDNFYDHHLRPTDPVEAIFRYIFLNPYAANLIARSDHWPHFYCAPEDWAWFKDRTDSDQPFPEWLL